MYAIRSYYELAWLRVLDEGDIVRLHADGQELGDALALRRHHLLGQIEAEDIAEQLQGFIQLNASYNFV